LDRIKTEKTDDQLSEMKAIYVDYKLSISIKRLKVLLIIVGIFNLILLMPDIMLLDNTYYRITAIILRVLFTFLLLIAFYNFRRIKKFKSMSLLISAFEILAIFNFIYVLTLYSDPDFLIQTMGMLILIITIFLVPNEFKYMLIVSILGSGAFLIFSYLYIEAIDMMEFSAAAVYIVVDIVLCAYIGWITERHQFQEFAATRKLECIGSIDYLTNIANRYKMDEEAARWINFCHDNNLPLSMSFVDIDDFKLINDEFGHLSGDSVLVDLTKLIRSRLRNTDIIARWGGDEFVLLFPSSTLTETVSIMENLKRSINEYVFIKDIKITCCYGIVEMKSDSDFQSMIKEADGLMYIGKKNDKNNLQFNESDVLSQINHVRSDLI